MRHQEQTPTKQATPQERYDKIMETLNANGVVQVCTYTRATQFDARHKDYFKVTTNGLYARYGNKWLCIDYANLRFGKRV